MSENGMSLSDGVIAQIAKLLQIALLSGTDVVDQLRLMKMIEEGGQLVLTPECQEMFESHIQKMMQEIDEWSDAMEEVSDKEAGEA